MLKVGLTGNIGSGKSLVAKVFGVLEIPVFHADEVSKSFLLRDEIKARLKGVFGDTIIAESGEVDRKALANLAFSGKEGLATLNALLHPLVMDEFRSWCALQGEKPYSINESAIIFEYGLRHYFDKIINVSCPEEIAKKRVALRDGVSEEAVMKRLRFQMQDNEKVALSDFIILNDGSELVLPQVLKIHARLSEGSTQ